MAKVLVVEDDTVLSSIMVRKLTSAGYEVHAALDGFSAELEAKDWHPDLMLLDLLLPDKDGWDILQHIRADNVTNKISVIVLSNLSDKETVEKVRKFGITDYFIKANTSPGEVVAKVRTMFPLDPTATPAAA